MPPRPPSPEHVADPGARWQAARERWTSPPSPNSSPTAKSASSSPPRKPKDAMFASRIATLERMLRDSVAASQAPPPTGRNGAGSSSPAPPAPLLAVPPSVIKAEDSGAGSSGSARTAKGKAKDEEVVDGGEEEPDGGSVIGGGGGGAEEGERHATQELKKVSEGIFLAFKQNRVLKQPLPLSLVTSLLYRSWLLDGTIPLNYILEPEPPMPAPRSSLLSPATTSAAPSPAPPSGSSFCSSARPTGPTSLLAALSARNSNAVTPLPSSSSSEPIVTPLDAPNGLSRPTLPAPTESEGSMGPPPLPSSSPNPLAASPPLPPQPDLEGMGGCGELGGKLKLDMMRGSRWRTEKDIASGSDVI
ncbi:hypothetical protein JCM8547_002077 [Rhodosporidiobolus lusitaniae]